MLLQMAHIWFYEPDYVTLHHDMIIMKENRAKKTHKLLQY